jgi:flotillin
MCTILLTACINRSTPFDMSLTIQAMTQEKLSLALPVMFTVGPESEVDKLKKYAILLTGNQRVDSTHVQNVIRGVIEGEIRYPPSPSLPRF